MELLLAKMKANQERVEALQEAMGSIQEDV
jgi:hypothetical protein